MAEQSPPGEVTPDNERGYPPLRKQPLSALAKRLTGRGGLSSSAQMWLALDRHFYAALTMLAFAVLSLLMLGAVLGSVEELLRQLIANIPLLALSLLASAVVGGLLGVSAGRAVAARLGVSARTAPPRDSLRPVRKLAAAMLLAAFLVIMVSLLIGSAVLGAELRQALLAGVNLVFIVAWVLQGFLGGQFLIAWAVGVWVLRRTTGTP